MDYVLGGASATCAGLFTNPLDVIKTRQQLQGELQANRIKNDPYKGVLQSFRSIFKAEGLRGIQKGLAPALYFQFFLNSSKLGLFQTVDTKGWTKNENGEHSGILCVLWGGISGTIGAVVASPFYMIKTQIQSQSVGKYAVGYQHHHKGVIDALLHIIRTQGFTNLWRGISGIAPRTAVASSAQLGSFTMVKENLSQFQIFRESLLLTACASSIVSGFCAVTCMTPFDVVATRVFNQGLDKNGRGLLYKNVFDCFWKTVQVEGVRSLYKGFAANYIRAAPHAILNLTFWEHFKQLKNIYYNK